MTDSAAGKIISLILAVVLAALIAWIVGLYMIDELKEMQFAVLFISAAVAMAARRAVFRISYLFSYPWVAVGGVIGYLAGKYAPEQVALLAF